MNQPASEARKKREVLDRLAPALLMHAVPGEGLGAHHMQPVQGACHAQAGLVSVGDGRLDEEFDDLGLESGERAVGGAHCGLNARIAHRPTKKIRAHLTDTLQRDQLLDAQIHQPSVEARAVLRGRVDPGGEGGPNLAARIRVST